MPGRKAASGNRALSAAIVIQLGGVAAAVISLFLVDSLFTLGDSLLGVASGVGMGAGLWAYYQGITRSSASVVSPATAACAAVLPFIYSLIRGAEMSTLVVAAAVVAFVGVAIATVENTTSDAWLTGLGWGLLSGLCYGIGLSVLVDVGSASGVWPVVTQRGSAAMILAAIALINRAEVLPPEGFRTLGAAAGCLAGISSILFLLGLQVDGPSAVVGRSMFPIFSIGVGHWFFAESVGRREMVGVVVALAGIAGAISGTS